MKKENIDYLLSKNADEHLISFDWDRLNKSISEKLNEVDKTEAPAISYGYIFKFAAGIAAAAAVVIVLVLVRTKPQPAAQFEKKGKVVVRLIENANSATVEIKQKSIGAVMVDTQPNRKNLAVCNVEILDTDSGQERNESRATWIIIRVPEPVLVETGQSRDEADFACLL
jgi:hypothetical protein